MTQAKKHVYLYINYIFISYISNLINLTMAQTRHLPDSAACWYCFLGRSETYKQTKHWAQVLVGIVYTLIPNQLIFYWNVKSKSLQTELFIQIQLFIFYIKKA